MKEQYIAPELELIRFMPAERLMVEDPTIDIFEPDQGQTPSEDPDHVFELPL